MKGSVCAFVLVVITVSAIAGPPTEFKHYRDDCMAEIGITDAKPPLPDRDEPNAKCYHACMMKKLGKMVDGTVILEKEFEMALRLVPDLGDDVKAQITECVKIANAAGDECEAAHGLHKCLKENDVLPPYHSSHHH